MDLKSKIRMKDNEDRIKNKILNLEINKDSYHYEFKNFAMRIYAYNKYNKIFNNKFKQYDIGFFKENTFIHISRVLGIDYFNDNYFILHKEMNLDTIVNIIIYLEKLDKLGVFI